MSCLDLLRHGLPGCCELYYIALFIYFTTTTTVQLRISTGAGGVHDTAMITTCVRAHNKGRAWKELELCALMQVAMIAASCTPPALVLILSWYCGGVSPSAVDTKTPLAPRWFHPLQLALVVFFLPPTSADTELTLRQLTLCGGGFSVVVVVDVCVCGGGGCT